MIKRIEDFFNTKTAYVLFGILAMGAVLRFYHLDYQSLWLDELYSIVPTNPDNSLGDVIDYAKGDQPPLFFIYIHYVFKIFGYTELVGRAACALVGLAGIIAIYFLGKECFGKATGVFAALITSVNYFHIYYSQELRFYSMAFLMALLSYLFFIRAFKRGKLSDYFAYVISTIGLLYTHYYGLIIFGTQIFVFLMLLLYKRDMRFLILSFISGALVIVAYTPWLPTIMNDLGTSLSWIKKPEPYFVAQYFYDYTGKDAFTSLLLVVLIFQFCKTFVRSVLSQETRNVFLILITWILLSYLVPYIRSILISPVLSNRYTIVTLPALIVLFAIGWSEIKNSKWRYSLSILLVLSAIINLIYFRQHYTRLQKDQFREASEAVLTQGNVKDPVYSNFSWHFSYYFRNSAISVKDIQLADFSTIDKFWLLQAHFSEEEMEDEIEKLLRNYKIVKKNSFFGANATLLQRK